MILLNFIKLIHLLNEIFLSTYIFIFPKKYDIYYVIYVLLIKIHWILLKNECILSYIEKRLKNKDYVLGSKPYEHPFHSLLPKNFKYIFRLLKFINLLVIFIRNIKNKYIVILIIFIVLFILYYTSIYMKSTRIHQ